MTIRQIEPSDQEALWNGAAGEAWVHFQPLLDSLFKPIEEDLVDTVRASHSRDVLDVGCGTGATTLAIDALADVRCSGIDLSEPMIRLARERAGRQGSDARFVACDAQRWKGDEASFDLIVSRFGLMFFDDPVEAFINLRRMGRKDAKLLFYAWRSPLENPFMTAAERTARPMLPDLPSREPGAPGQFAFAGPARVASICRASGWGEAQIEPVDFECRMKREDLVDYVTRLGPVGLALARLERTRREAIVEEVLPAFEPFADGHEIRFAAACWRVTAANAGSRG